MKTLKQILRCRRGAVVVLMAAAVVGLTGMAALAVDAGMLYLNKYRLANAAGRGNAAGRRNCREDPTMRSPRRQASLPPAIARTTDNIQPVLSKNNTAITVTISRNVPLYFAKVLGLASSQVTATATTEVKTYTGGTNGIVPLASSNRTLSLARPII